MTTKRIGVIESVNEKEKLINFYGYGEYLGEFTLPDEIAEADFGLVGMGISTSKVKLENGKEIWVSGSVWYASEESMKDELLKYEKKGYTIKHVDP